MEPIIEIKNISKKYKINHFQGRYVALRDVMTNVFKSPFGFLKSKIKKVAGLETKEEFWALKDINLSVNQGEIIGVIGKNGAGKSTLLKIISRITPPTTGEIRLRGRVGSLLEVGTGFHPELSGRENILLNGAILGMTKAEIIQKFDKIVEFAGIEKFIDTPVKYYSSGMYVRLAFSVAAHLEPDILLVDEVLAVGDSEFQKKCLGKMEEVTKQRGRTIMFVSHNMGAIQSLCTKCILIDQGKIIKVGKTNEVISEYLSNVQAKSSVEISEQQHSKGTQEALINKVSLTDSQLVSKNVFFINEPLIITADIEIKEHSRPLSCWLLIYNQYGNVVVSSFQKDFKKLIDPVSGRHKLNIKFDDLRLLPNRYILTIGLFAHDTLDSFEFSDWIEQCLSFEISQTFYDGKSFDQRLGMVDRPAQWQLSE